MQGLSGRPSGRLCYGPATLAPVSRPAALVLLVLAACGGATYEAGEYRDDETRYRLASPEGWRRLSVPGGGDLAWSHEATNAIIQTNSTCDPALDIPLAALRNQLLVGFTERELREEVTEPFAGREALRTHLVAKLDGRPRELLLVILKKDGCVYDLGLFAPPGRAFESARPTFDRMLRSFETVVSRGGAR